jgi:hypothetical protein
VLKSENKIIDLEQKSIDTKNEINVEQIKTKIKIEKLLNGSL